MVLYAEIAMLEEGYDAMHERLIGIEHTLEVIKDKLDVVVRLEERQDASVKRIDRVDGRLDVHGERLNEIEKEMASNNQQTGMIERGAWVAVSAVVGFVVYLLKGAA
jgi:predicted RNase H-like nuclease (RuvC/YqgF family)